MGKIARGAMGEEIPGGEGDPFACAKKGLPLPPAPLSLPKTRLQIRRAQGKTRGGGPPVQKRAAKLRFFRETTGRRN